MRVSLYNQYLIADQYSKRIEAMGQGVGTIFFMKPYYSAPLTVMITVEAVPRNITSDERQALAVAWIDQHGGELQRSDGYRDGYDDLRITNTAAHGVKVVLDFGLVEKLPVKSEQDGDEAEALNT